MPSADNMRGDTHIPGEITTALKHNYGATSDFVTKKREGLGLLLQWISAAGNTATRLARANAAREFLTVNKTEVFGSLGTGYIDFTPQMVEAAVYDAGSREPDDKSGPTQPEDGSEPFQYENIATTNEPGAAANAPSSDGKGSTGAAPGANTGGGGGTPPPSSGGGGGSTASSGDHGSHTEAGSEDPFATDAGNLPGNYEIWRNNGSALYLVYETAEGSGTFVAWQVTAKDMEQLGHLFPDGPEIARETTSSELAKLGVWNGGRIDELNNPSEEPFLNFMRDMEKEAEIRPWLLDPEIIKITAEAMLEGREVTEAELMSTEYMRGKSQAELDWIVQSSRSPETASMMLEDNRQVVRGWLEDAGVFGASEGMVDLLARKWTTGEWGQGKTLNEIDKIGNPSLGELDPDLAAAADGSELSLISERTDGVRELVERWLGPHFAANWSDKELERWARDIHADPNMEQELVETLKDQRVALFPTYENRNLSYEAIAGPWVRFMSSQWGQTPDETDPFMHEIINLNDSAEAQRRAREEGLARGIKKVSNDMLRGLGSVLGNGIVQQR